MRYHIILTLLMNSFINFTFAQTTINKNTKNTVYDINPNLHVFYYSWYGNPSTDSIYRHWSHNVIPHWSDKTWDNMPKFPGGEDIGANYYPELGCYSSNNDTIIDKHFQMMASAGIGVCVISWWGAGSYEDKSVPKYLSIAKKYHIKIAFHIEPRCW